MSNDDAKTKTFLNPFEDYAIVQRFYTDDGLFDGEQYAEWLLIQEEGDRMASDYAEPEAGTGDCD